MLLRVKATLTTLLPLTFASGAPSQQPQTVDLIFLDVGQGDAVVVRSPEGKVALIDAGPGVDVVSVPRLLKVVELGPFS